MSRDKAGSRTNVEDAAPEVGILVRYRVVGGPVDVDQRLTVFEDGAVVLDERHRTRDAIRLQLDAAELEEVRSALAQIPDEVWGLALPRLAWGRVRRALATAWIPDHSTASASDYELRHGRKAIFKEKVAIAEYIDIRAAVTLLDALRLRAVRAEPR
jgi:hypothetical protein